MTETKATYGKRNPLDDNRRHMDILRRLAELAPDDPRLDEIERLLERGRNTFCNICLGII